MCSLQIREPRENRIDIGDLCETLAETELRYLAQEGGYGCFYRNRFRQ